MHEHASRAEIEARLAAAEPDVEVLLAEVVGGDTLRAVHRPSRRRHARALRARHARAAPSCASATRSRSPRPGTERPLTKPDHFRRFLGRRARVRTRERARTATARFTGELVGASDDEVTVAADDGRRRDPVRRHPPIQPGRGVAAMSTRDPGGHARARAREGHLAREADGRARGRAAVRLQEAARRGQVRARRDRPRDRRLPRHRADHPRAPRGAADRRDDRRGHDRRPRDGRDARARGPGDRPGEVRASTATRSTSATSRPTTSAASPRRPPSR